MSETAMEDKSNKRKKESQPPEGYKCNICQGTDHWIQQCPDREQHNNAKKNKRRKKKHTPVPGVDPSKKDIETARALQKLVPPKCLCGIPARLKKVKRSHANESSRAIGKYFFFCSKKKEERPCRFARPVKVPTISRQHDQTKPSNDE
eukprot:Nitzschia sp. Nitz4//scaffold93_size78505//31181//31624//NITZ4_005418-RA/size78505-processed-gene-0.31-mRNA-1//-1//CDS//3329560282//3751//frame0